MTRSAKPAMMTASTTKWFLDFLAFLTLLWVDDFFGPFSRNGGFCDEDSSWVDRLREWA